MIKVVTHSGSFHADDVFSVAVFQLLLGKDQIEVIRTRDEDIIAEADYVVDVGGQYDHEVKRYDHHQNGAPVRENGIPYAGFGLVWRHYGVSVAGSEEVANVIEERLCQAIDAGDNGVSLYSLTEFNIRPFDLPGVISTFHPDRTSEKSMDEAFMDAVDFARALLVRVMGHVTANLELRTMIAQVYESADDASVLVFDQQVSKGMFVEYPDVNVVVYKMEDTATEQWRAVTIQKSHDTFESRVSFPESWGGLRDDELAQASGLDDAVFCHKARFLFVSETKESAVAAARMAS